jgi:hypothetical protein
MGKQHQSVLSTHSSAFVGLVISQELTQRERAYTLAWTKLIKASGFQSQ